MSGDVAAATAADIRDRTRRLVADYVPAGPRDSASRAEIIEFLDTVAEPFSRDAQLAHITASAVLWGRRGTILHRHKITGTWLQPGGHVDGGEAPWDAVLREVEEETGFIGIHRNAAKLFDVDVHDTPRRHRHLDIRYLIDVDDGDPAPQAGESPDVRWFTWDEAVRVGDPTLVDVLPKAVDWS